METAIKIQKPWSFKLDNEKCPSENVKALLAQLSIDKLKLFTTESLHQDVGHQFTVEDLSLSGTAVYVDLRLKEIHKAFKKMLDKYLHSDESIANKRYEFLLSINYIGAAVMTNYENEEMVEKNNQIKLFEINTLNSKIVTLNEIELNPTIIAKWNEHLFVRNKYLALMENYLEIVYQRIQIEEYQQALLSEKGGQSKKEMQLLEVWIALEIKGFLDHVPDDLAMSKKRKEFFSIFNLTDRNYNDKHNEIKRKKTLGDFNKDLADALRERYNKNPSKKEIIQL